MKAVHIKDWPHRESNSVVSPGRAAVYQLSPPKGDIEYVFVSQSTVMGEPETYAFACDAEGNVEHWGELEGSMKGDHSLEDVLREMGYEP